MSPKLFQFFLATWIGSTLAGVSPNLGQQPQIAANARLEAWKLHQEMANESPFKDLSWQPMGPKFAGGRIESIDAPRGDISTIYAGVGAGGIWKTTNAGLTWKPIFEHESTFAIGDLTVAPSDPNIIWAGTGECHLSGTSFAGTGVFKSIDAGATWTNMGLHETAHIGKIVIDPVNPAVVYVAAMGRSRAGGERGIYKTADGGKSFERILFAGDQVAFVDLVQDPKDRNRLFATAWDRGNDSNSGIFRTEDAGKNWQRLGEGLLKNNMGRVAIDLCQSNPSMVYALVVDLGSPDYQRRGLAAVLFRSDDSGNRWERTHEGYLPTYVGWDFCDVRVAPDDPDRVYVGGLRLLTSVDGGKTFAGGGMRPNRARGDVLRLHPHPGNGMHLDVHEIWIDPEHPERMMLGNDGGLYVSHDRGEKWLHLNNLPIAEFYRIHVDHEEPFHIWGGTQDNASFVGPGTARFEAGEDDPWEQVFLDPWDGGDGFSTFPDPNDPKIVYYAQQQGDLKRARSGELRSGKRITPQAGPGESKLQWAWDTPFFASQHAGDTILYCAAQRVMRSQDSGNSWNAISPDLTRDGLLALAESPLDPKRLVAGGGRGQVHLTTDGGENWQAVSAGLPGKTVRDIACSAHDPNRIYVVLSGKSEYEFASHVFVSHDFGGHWQSIANNLPQESVNAIAEDPKTDGLVFVGTDLGVYVSTTGGEEWDSLCKSFPTAAVFDLALQSRDGILVAATHGLSLFKLDVHSIRGHPTAAD